jgi:adenine-specific DNA-methyltransferase
VKEKLELTWLGKETRPKLEPRILRNDASRSHHAKHRVSELDLFENRLIFGDNLLALKALEQEFAGKGEVRLHRSALQHRVGICTV